MFFILMAIHCQEAKPSIAEGNSARVSAPKHRVVLKEMNSAPAPSLRKTSIPSSAIESPDLLNQTVQDSLDSTEVASSNISSNSSTDVPVGAWVGIGLGILLLILIGVYYFIGQKRVTDYFVAIISARLRKGGKQQQQQQQSPEHNDTTSLDVRCSSKSAGAADRITSTSSTPRTTVDVIIAPIEIDSDGRMSPRLPIGNRRRLGSSTGGGASTPSTIN